MPALLPAALRAPPPLEAGAFLCLTPDAPEDLGVIDLEGPARPPPPTDVELAAGGGIVEKRVNLIKQNEKVAVCFVPRTGFTS